MKTQKTGGIRKGLATIFAASLAALSLTLAPANIASADEGATDLPIANIDPKEKVSLTIHKFANPAWGDDKPNNGSQLEAPVNAKPLKGVTFEVHKITDLNLVTNESDAWSKVAKDRLVATESCGATIDKKPATLQKVFEGDTGEDGSLPVIADDLGIGAYVVCETGAGGNNIVKKAAPFIVVLPMPAVAGENVWNYDVHVYPKNTVTKVEKTVDTTDAVKAGDLVTWTVKAELPNDAEKITAVVVTDVIDPRLAFQDTDENPTVPEARIGETKLDPRDYEYTFSVVNVSGVDKDQITIKLTESGLVKANANKGKTVEFDIATEVVSAGDGVIPNQATVYFNNPNPTVEDEGYPTDKPETYWGELIIKKYTLNGEEEKILQGAEFAIYKKKSDDAGKCVASDVDGVPALVVKTGADGLASAVLKTEQVEANNYFGEYCLKETKAPAGYVLSEEPIYTLVKRGETTENTVKVKNEKPEYPDLPVTGGQGQVVLLIGGASLLALAVAMGAYGSRRKVRN